MFLKRCSKIQPKKNSVDVYINIIKILAMLSKMKITQVQRSTSFAAICVENKEAICVCMRPSHMCLCIQQVSLEGFIRNW